MSEILNPPVSPPDKGQGTGGQDNPANTPAAGNNQPSGGANQGQKIEIGIEELNDLKRKAGRWDARGNDERDKRRQQRQNRVSQKSDDIDDPEVLESLRQRDETIGQLSSENFKLKTQNQVRDLLEKDEYKNLPLALKKAIRNNPLGFVNSNSKTVDDALYDIQDYLDDQLDDDASKLNPGNKPLNKVEEKPDGSQIPPAGGSGPSSPNPAGEVDVTGKSGTARSVSILQSILKNKKK